MKRPKNPKFPRGEPRWRWHPNRGPDGKICSFSCRVEWLENGARQRKNVPTVEEADELIAAIKKRTVQADAGLTTQVTQLTKAQIEFAELAFTRLRDAGYYVPEEIESASSILKAVQWFADNYNPDQAIPPTVSEAVSRFLATRVNKSPRTYKSHKTYLEEFATNYGSQSIAAITPAMVDEHIRACPSGNVAKLHRWDSLHALFEFARGKKNVSGTWIGVNPVKAVSEPEYSPSRPKIYTIKECEQLIKGAVLNCYAPNIVVRLFAMVRADEMKAMVRKGKSIWTYVNLKTGWMHLPANVVKTKADKERGGRNIRINPTLDAWLREFRRRGWDISDSRTLDERVRKFASPRKMAEQDIPLEDRYANLVRHTAISAAATRASLTDCAMEAGTSEAIIRRHYLERLTQKEGDRFFSLTPSHYRLDSLWSRRTELRTRSRSPIQESKSSA